MKRHTRLRLEHGADLHSFHGVLRGGVQPYEHDACAMHVMDSANLCDPGSELLDGREPACPATLGVTVSAKGDRGVVLVHDYLTQRGGAERVALELARLLEPRRLLTSTYMRDRTYDGFYAFDVKSSFLQWVPLLRRDPRIALPLLPLAWSWRRAIGGPLVVASSSGWSHGIRVKPGTRKVVYCHNPARWLYQTEEYVLGASSTVRFALAVLTPFLRWWDQRAARTVDTYIANSTAVARRIEQVYGRSAIVIHPPMTLDVNGLQQSIENIEPGYFLTIGRGRGYKNLDVVVQAAKRVSGARLVVLGASEEVVEDESVTRLDRVSEDELRWLYANARALVSVSFEDFGLTPVEAAAMGTPSLLLRAGGFLDSTIEGVTGCFVDDATVDSVASALVSFPTEWDSAAIKASAQRFSPESFAQLMSEILAASLAALPSDDASGRRFANVSVRR